MERKTEEKQPVDLSKQSIVKLHCQGFVVLFIFILLYFELFCLCCLTNCYNSAFIQFLISVALLVCMKLFLPCFFWLVFLLLCLFRKKVDV